MAGEYRYQGVNRVDRVNRDPRRNLAFTRMLRSWVEQHLGDLVSRLRLVKLMMRNLSISKPSPIALR
jgi:hypothetical protein